MQRQKSFLIAVPDAVDKEGVYFRL